eukprot:UN05152
MTTNLSSQQQHQQRPMHPVLATSGSVLCSICKDVCPDYDSYMKHYSHHQLYFNNSRIAPGGCCETCSMSFLLPDAYQQHLLSPQHIVL